MSKRLAYLGLGALLLTLNSGCCLVNCINCWHDQYLAHYQATHFHDCGCGEVFIDNWHNNPPQCVDPCDQWGNFIGRKWWVPNCMGCRGGGIGCGGCGNCGPGSCPGISPAGRMNGPGNQGGPMYDNGSPTMGETITPTEEVPVPYQSNRGPAPYQSYQGNMRGYQQGPMQQNGPSRVSRQPRYVRPPDQRVTRRQPPRAEADVYPADHQTQTAGPFYDDAEAGAAGGYRVSTSSSTANYRR